MKNRGTGLTSVVLAIGAAVGVGVGGYFVLGGECASCTTETAAVTPAAALPVAGEVDDCCPAEGEATAELVSATTEVDCGECDADAAECPLESGECDGEKAECPIESGECEANKAECPTENSECDADKADCDAESSECEGEEKTNEDT